MLLAEKSSEIFPKHEGYFFISEYFPLKWHIFVALKIKNCCLWCNAGLNKIYTWYCNVVLFNPCVGPLPRIKISFPLLSICTDELISAPNTMTFLPTLPSGNEYSIRVSNPIP